MARNDSGSNRRARAELQAVASPARFDLVIIELAVLFGFAVGWLCAAFTTMFEPGFSTKFHAHDGAVTAACLFAVSFGISLPRRGAAKIVRRNASRELIQSPDVADGLQTGKRLLVNSAMAALAAGLAGAASPQAVRAGNRLHDAAIRGFFWIPPIHALLVIVTAGIAVLPALALIGVLWTCLVKMAAGVGQTTHLISFTLLSAAAGASASATLLNIAPDSLFATLSSVPLFIAAIIIIHHDGKPGIAGHSVMRLDRATLPECDMPTPSNWTLSLLVACVVLAICITDAATGRHDASSAPASWLIAAMGLGWLITPAPQEQAAGLNPHKTMRVAGLASIGASVADPVLNGVGASPFWIMLVGAAVAAACGRALRSDLGVSSIHPSSASDILDCFSARCCIAAGVVLTIWTIIQPTPRSACFMLMFAGLIVILTTTRAGHLLISRH